MLKTILATIAVGAILVWFCYSLWHDGYNDGVMEERRKRTRLMAQYNTSISTFRTEISLLWADLNDLKKKMAAEKKPLTFNYEHSDEPIGKVVCAEECDGGLRFRIKKEASHGIQRKIENAETDDWLREGLTDEEVQEAIDVGLTPVQKEALDSLCN